MNEDIKYNKKLRKRFLSASLPLVRAWTEEVTGSAAIYGLSDELSIALVTFNFAIDKFTGKGDFYEFAKKLVRHRLYQCVQEKAERQTALRKNFS